MHIVCPHCTTSYAINLATLGAAGRNVRCSRCKEVWLAHPGDAVEMAEAMPAEAAIGGDDAAAEWARMARDEGDGDGGASVVDSPSISADWPADGAVQVDWQAAARDEDDDLDGSQHGLLARALARLRDFFRPAWDRLPAVRLPAIPAAGLPATCAAMGALVLALLLFRADVVRLLPQTAAFYRMAGLDVNLRGLAIEGVKISNETVEGKPVLVIEGVITSATRKAVELPRLRFSVRDAQGAEIYAWNAVLEQPSLQPGEKAWFKSRLASPPPEGRNIDVRFFNKQDVAGGHA
jgi:predicted Zn finger-like uncharacterized protein